MVQKQIELMRLRNTHPAFAGKAAVAVSGEHAIEITWTLDMQWIKLLVDLSVPSATISGSSPSGEFKPIIIRNS